MNNVCPVIRLRWLTINKFMTAGDSPLFQCSYFFSYCSLVAKLYLYISFCHTGEAPYSFVFPLYQPLTYREKTSWQQEGQTKNFIIACCMQPSYHSLQSYSFQVLIKYNEFSFWVETINFCVLEISQ